MRLSAISAVSFVVFIGALFLSIFAYLLNWTTFWADLPAFDWTVGRLTIFRLELGAGGGRIAQGWDGLWIIAIVGQVVMLTSMFMKPQRQAEYL